MHKQADKKPKVFKTLESLSILLEKKKSKPKEKKEGALTPLFNHRFIVR
tara:strand:+ start:7033 stop:7179 length:147 start_codon:yes stop_codon:yes gene_type:complete